MILRRVRDVLAPALRAAAAQHDRRRHARELRRDVDRPALGRRTSSTSARARAVGPRAPSAGRRLDGDRTARRASCGTRAESRRGSGCRRRATGSGSPSVASRYGRARSIAAPAIGAPSSRPRPFVVVASPETAPRCSSGISLKSRPQASVITSPPATATGTMSAKYQSCHVVAKPATRKPPP